MTDLRHLLQAAADREPPIDTDLDDLLRRAQRTSRRARLRHTGLGVVAAGLVALVPLAAPHLGRLGNAPVHQPAPASTGPERTPNQGTSPSAVPTSTVAAPLTAEEIVERCRPQVSRDEHTAAVDWVLGHPDRTYAVGEVVGLVDAHPPTYDLGDGQVADAGAPPTLCVIPEAGDEEVPVPANAFQPRPAQHELITQLCSQVVPQSPGAPEPDLRGAELVAVAADGERVAAVARQSGRTYTCTLEGLTNGWVHGNVYQPAGMPLKEVQVDVQATSEGVKSEAVTPTAFYWGAGLLPKGISAIVFDFRDRPDQRVAVSDRAYAYVLTQSPAYGLGAFRTKLLDASGAVVCASGWSDAGGSGYACPGAR